MKTLKRTLALIFAVTLAAVLLPAGPAAAADNEPPDPPTIAFPDNGTTVPNRLTIVGELEDDQALGKALIFVVRFNPLEYLQDDGSWGGYHWFEQEVTDPGQDESGFVWQAPADIEAGNYTVLVRAVDAAGNQQPTTTNRAVTVEASPPAGPVGADIPIITGILAQVFTTTPPDVFVREEIILPDQIDHNTAHSNPYKVIALENTEEIRYSLIIDPDGPQPSGSFDHQPGGLWNLGTQVFPMTFFSPYTGFVNNFNGMTVPGSENGEYTGFGWQGVACGQDGCAISDIVYSEFVTTLP